MSPLYFCLYITFVVVHLFNLLIGINSLGVTFMGRREPRAEAREGVSRSAACGG